MKRLIRIILLAAAAIIGAGYTGAALGGNIDPRTWSWPGILAMTFPLWAIALAAVTVITAFTRSWMALAICIVAWIAGYPTLSIVSPINVAHAPADGRPTLSVLTYNVYNLRDYTGSPIEGANPTIAAIMDADAGIAILQECTSLEKPLPMLGYTSAMADSLKALYPYRRFNPNGLAILSRYPVTPLSISQKPSGSAEFAGWQITIDSLTVHIYDIHLQSFGLDTNDKQLYRDITDGDNLKHNMSEARHDLLPKVARALHSHADEADMLRDIIDADTCSHIILCGDFNDVPASFAITSLRKDCHMQSAWDQAGMGPTSTYRDNRFYFHIDHILYRGLSRPLSTRRLRAGQSDHYPVETTFQL